ncbi:PRC-barrel domain-containing protein [Rhizobium sp. TRM95111]|uniref:PRC-barrel domain-containing protein n=1 Tax=Rhizobium alarense TaxID=2846851 RepID=UPI001F2D51B7|nr:PRC-barrel domain-containing protein [Rhizobium alarense]MCF3642274.1 PRC-barrel domain-containing protein [Rhizobium alarense]
MANKLLTSVAAGALFLGAAIAPAAYAQDTTQPSTNQMETQPVTPEAEQGTTDMGATPSDDSAATQTTPETDPAQDTAAAAAGGDYLTVQSPDQISANTYIGQSVYNSADESIGKISDLILEKDGGITAAVIGVGGFLGIGEKWVAVPFDKVAVSQMPDTGEVKLSTTETAESLDAAPEFKTAAQQMAEQNSVAPVDTSTTSSTTTGTGTAPATAE